MWWRPGGSPANGFTWTPEKFPLPSAVADPMTFPAISQYSDIGSLARNELPLTVIWLVGPPAVRSSAM